MTIVLILFRLIPFLFVVFHFNEIATVTFKVAAMLFCHKFDR